MRDAAGAARETVGADQQRDGLAALDHARHAQPGGERKRAHGRQPGRPTRSSATRPKLPAWRTRFIALSAVRPRTAASPAPRTHSSRRRSRPSAGGRYRIESIARIDQRDRFAACALRRPAHGTAPSSGRPSAARRSPTDARAAARRRARRRWPARPSVPALRVLCRHSADGRQRDVELAGAQQRFEMGEGRHGRRLEFRFIFANGSEYKRAAVAGIKRHSSHPCKCWKNWMLR